MKVIALALLTLPLLAQTSSNVVEKSGWAVIERPTECMNGHCWTPEQPDYTKCTKIDLVVQGATRYKDGMVINGTVQVLVKNNCTEDLHAVSIYLKYFDGHGYRVAEQGQLLILDFLKGETYTETLVLPADTQDVKIMRVTIQQSERN